MKLYQLDEPALEFGSSRDICPKSGISSFGVYDTRFDIRRENVYVGAIGLEENIYKLSEWINKCSGYIPPKNNNRHPNLFYPFYGFKKDMEFYSSIILGESLTKSFTNGDLKKILKIDSWIEKLESTIKLYFDRIEFLSQNKNVDVIICIIPDILFELIKSSDDNNQDNGFEFNFRRMLKAKSMHLGKPLQLIREISLTTNKKQQDDATKAWNFCTALYYKANKTVPWRLVSNINKPSSCFVGIGFYRSRDGSTLHSSLAQIFDELGNGVILRGTPVQIDKNDRKPFLNQEQAYNLLKNALQTYRIALSNSPGRLIIHKSSNYKEEEIQGFRDAMEDSHIDAVDFVNIFDSDARLFRSKLYPPYRGAVVELDKDNHILYTRGSVPYYQTYPGMYIPTPLHIRIHEADESPQVICNEILGLTKMNWNTTQFDRKYPITIECARSVGEILKYVDDQEKPQISYSFYM